jgi:hypothetical protein
MSALQQSPICGLEEPEFPYRGEACQGYRAAEQGPPNRVASYRGGADFGFARWLAVIAAMVVTRSATGEQDRG